MAQTIVSGLSSAARGELRRGEIVRWAGAPEGPAPLLPLAFLIVFGLFWTGMSILWEWLAVAFAWDAWIGDNVSRTPRWLALAFALFGAPFVVVGFGVLASPWLAIRKRRNTLYVVTDQRLLKIESGRSKSVESIEARQIFEVARKDKPYGFGDVEVSRSTATDSEGELIQARFTLDSIRDARGAEAALNALARRPA